MKEYLKSKWILWGSVLAGIVIMILQMWFFSEALSPENLLDTSHPANTLSLLLAGLGVLSLMALHGQKTQAVPYRYLFPRSIFAAVSCFVAAVGILASTLLTPEGTIRGLNVLLRIFGFAAAGCMVYEGLCRMGMLRQSVNTHMAVTVYFVLHLVFSYGQWSNQTQWQKYFFPMLQGVFLAVAGYYRACLLGAGVVKTASYDGDCPQFGKNAEGSFRFFSLAAILFAFPAAVRGDWLFFASGALWLFSALEAMPEGRSLKLSGDTLFAMGRLEQKNHQAYAVGGCVRDSLLGIEPKDYDMCTDATPEQMKKIFSDQRLISNGEKHGTIGVVRSGNVTEITTFRSEGAYRDNRHPDWVKFEKDVKMDLARRDFTVNAMAYSPATGIIDPWGGREDLKNKVLRTVRDPKERFTEDPLRILRGVRFAVTYALTPEPETEQAMTELAPLMDTLARERVFEELRKLLPVITAQDLMRYAPVLTRAIPELKPMVDFDQCSPHHAYDVYTHTAYTVEKTPQDITLRLAALLHDVGKPAAFTKDENCRGHFHNHAKISAELAEGILKNLKVPNALRERVVFLVEHHMTPLEADKKLLRRRIGQYGIESVEQLLALQQADMASKGVPEEAETLSDVEELLNRIRQEDDCFSLKDLAVDGSDLMKLGIPAGPGLGNVLESLLVQVQEEKLPNGKEALLREAGKLWQQMKEETK